MHDCNNHRKVIAHIEDFYQRKDNSIKSFVSFETLAASDVIINEWKTLMLNSATVNQSIDETTARKHIQQHDTIYVIDEIIDRIVERIRSLLIENSCAMQVRQKLAIFDTIHSHWKNENEIL